MLYLHKPFLLSDNTAITINLKRATFETSKYPQWPWDLYTAPKSKCIGADPPPPPPHPPPPPPPQKKNKKQKTNKQ